MFVTLQKNNLHVDDELKTTLNFNSYTNKYRYQKPNFIEYKYW